MPCDRSKTWSMNDEGRMTKDEGFECGTLQAVADDEEVEAAGEDAGEFAERGEKRARVFFLSEPADVEEQRPFRRDAECRAEDRRPASPLERDDHDRQ